MVVKGLAGKSGSYLRSELTDILRSAAKKDRKKAWSQYEVEELFRRAAQLEKGERKPGVE